ncbi:hypothetical protein SAV14893_025900 [Streptomyces avermitilis]|uniref:Uncharacterized protein n=1 Tax=Streptomyces avermitilis TaxID=33903 RepID=A0A4D4LY24_STRAX|nr:hypothetical protein SAVMC3_37860 [Streptomyces avermitilis]GDY63197.1 hypothetical protein SAV14893_025900 [Streptomyces avermitilis]GDY76672.1 hypothetical protein SAV31267_061570 [Streptomyces avermitilis]GDY85602.1 hypothetical protein SAVCW2_48010 [Streptomyces avermitilis]
MTEPEQLLSETVPAKFTARSVGAAEVFVPAVDFTAAEVFTAAADFTAAAGSGAATAGAAPAPAITRAKSAATRGFLMWGSPLAT